MTDKLTKVNEIGYTLSKMSTQIKSVLPEDVKLERFMRVCLTSIQNNASVLSADRDSLWRSCIECATDGLIPDGREAAFVVMGKAVKYMPMVAGVIKNMKNSSGVAKVKAIVVYEADEFEYWIDERGEHLRHVPMLGVDKGNPMHCYAMAIMQDGICEIEVMSFKEIEEIRKKSRAGSNGPWFDFWGEMAKKTVIKRLSKRLPTLNDRAIRVIESDNEIYKDEHVTDKTEDDKKSRLEQVIESQVEEKQEKENEEL